MPFCYAPWTNIDISPTGDISPCCKFLYDKYNTPVHNIQNNSINEYMKGDVLDTVKSQFLKNQWPAGCERCRIEEENGIKSKRQLDYIRWNSYYQTYDFSKSHLLTASIAFGNACNLKCITCNANASSTWRKEWKSIHNVDIKPLHFKHSNLVQEVINLTKDELIHFDIPGGEPFISGVNEQKYILKSLIESGQSKNISIHYTTNVTKFPDDSWWELWKHFKEIDMQLSIDSTDSHFEYIRYPADWESVNKNIQRYKAAEKSIDNLRLSISHTVSAFNIFYIGDFFKWCDTEKLPKPWLGRVHSPEYMRPSVWPHDAKDKIIRKLNESCHPDVKDWIKLLKNTDDSDKFSKFLDNLYKHDGYRNLDFSKTFPEMAEFIQ